jgi:hypothetical protein
MAMLTKTNRAGDGSEENSSNAGDGNTEAGQSNSANEKLLADEAAKANSASSSPVPGHQSDNDLDWLNLVAGPRAEDDDDSDMRKPLVSTPWTNRAPAAAVASRNQDPQPAIPGSVNPSVQFGHGAPGARDYVPTVLNNSQPYSGRRNDAVVSNSSPTTDNSAQTAKSSDPPLVEITVPPLRAKGSVPANYHVPEWPRRDNGHASGRSSKIDRPVQQSSGEPVRSNPSGSNKSFRDAQAMAAQLGLSAGSGGLGFSLQTAPTGKTEPFSKPATAPLEVSRPEDIGRVRLLPESDVAPEQATSREAK